MTTLSLQEAAEAAVKEFYNHYDNEADFEDTHIAIDALKAALDVSREGDGWVEEGDLRSTLWKRVDMSSQKHVAEDLGISPQYLHDVLSSRRDVSFEVAKKLGFQKVVRFLPSPPKGSSE